MKLHSFSLFFFFFLDGEEFYKKPKVNKEPKPQLYKKVARTKDKNETTKSQKKDITKAKHTKLNPVPVGDFARAQYHDCCFLSSAKDGAKAIVSQRMMFTDREM